MKILVGYDGDPGGHRALERAADLAAAFDAEVAVISVAPRSELGEPTPPWKNRAVHEREAEAARRVLEHRGVYASVMVVDGDPVEEIQRAAEEGEFDTIVIGTRANPGLTKRLEDRVSARLAAGASGTVVIVH